MQLPEGAGRCAVVPEGNVMEVFPFAFALIPEFWYDPSGNVMPDLGSIVIVIFFSYAVNVPLVVNL